MPVAPFALRGYRNLLVAVPGAEPFAVLRRRGESARPTVDFLRQFCIETECVRRRSDTDTTSNPCSMAPASAHSVSLLPRSTRAFAAFLRRSGRAPCKDLIVVLADGKIQSAVDAGAVHVNLHLDTSVAASIPVRPLSQRSLKDFPECVLHSRIWRLSEPPEHLSR